MKLVLVVCIFVSVFRVCLSVYDQTTFNRHVDIVFNKVLFTIQTPLFYSLTPVLSIIVLVHVYSKYVYG